MPWHHPRVSMAKHKRRSIPHEASRSQATSAVRPAERRPGTVEAAPFRFWQLVPVAAVLALVFVLYAPSLDGEFVFDDPNSISQSELIRSLTPLVRFLRLSTRPLTDYSYAINYAIGAYSL